MKLNVYRDFMSKKELVGSISYGENSQSSFSYDDKFINKARIEGQLGISKTLPLTKMLYSEKEFQTFFIGLLPEEKRLRDIGKKLQIDPANHFDLLNKLGCESIGALTFLS